MPFEQPETSEKQAFSESTPLTGQAELLDKFDSKAQRATDEENCLKLEKSGTLPSLKIDDLGDLPDEAYRMGGFENDKGFIPKSADTGTAEPWQMGGFENDKGFTPQIPDTGSAEPWQMGGFENDKGFIPEIPDVKTGNPWQMGGFENDKGFIPEIPDVKTGNPWQMGGFENDKGFVPQADEIVPNIVDIQRALDN
jgi:hypothetical protein